MTKQDAILTRLKFISKIKSGDKINTRNHLAIQPNNFITRISRTVVLQDSRTNALLFISDTIAQAIELIDNFKNSQRIVDKNLLKILLIDLKAAKIGINNLSDTYCDDLIIVSEFQTILQNIDFTLEEFDIPITGSASIPITPSQTTPSQTPLSTPQTPDGGLFGTSYEEDDY